MKSEKRVIGSGDRIATLTFVFTDVVGSTRLWEEHPVEMGRAMERHDAVATSVMAEHSVLSLKNTGDGFMGVFGSAFHAVLAAIELQKTLVAEDWSGGVRPEVRIGIHTGAATVRHGDFFGSTVNRAARVEEVAHGGQVIMSQSTAELAAEHLGPDVHMIDLGTRRLRDLAQPEQLFQAVGAGMQEQFPPLPTLDHFRHNLPIEWSSFVGRERDLAVVAELLHSNRLVTLHGPGGVGKTRLALQVAAQRVDEHPDGIWLTRLDTIDADENVVHAVATALGAAATATQTVEQALIDWGRHRAALLLLDNCEHVVEGVAALVALLLRSCPDLRVMATGREGLGLTGEAVHEVDPLPTPQDTASATAVAASQSGALFLERARAAQAGFEITDENAEVIARICDRLDGIPLAIELAAARLKVLSPDQLEQRLNDRFRVLAGGDRTAMPRHRTLQATVEWSYDLLNEQERTLFNRLSVFRGGFTLSAAEGVSGFDAPDVLDLLSHLVDRSMVMASHSVGNGDPRFGLLDTLRDFARDRLEASNEAEALHERLVDYVGAVAGEAAIGLPGPDESEWLDRLDADFANIRRAVTWELANHRVDRVLRVLGDLKMFFIARDEIMPEARSWVEIAVDELNAEPSIHLADALSTGGILAWSVGDLGEADRLQGRSLELARELGGPDEVFRATGDLGLIAVDRGDLERARTLFSEGLAVARDGDNPGDTAVALANLAHATPMPEQETLILDALHIHRQTGRLTGIAHMSLMLAWLNLSDGDLDSGREWFRAAQQGFEQLHNQGAQVEALCGLADVALQRGDPAAADASVARAEALAAHIDWPGAGAMALTRRALLRRVDDPAGCLEALADAGDAWGLSGLEAGLAENLGMRAKVALDLGDAAAARESCVASATLWKALRRSAGNAWVSTIAAEVERLENGPEAALPHYGRALAALVDSRRDPHTIDGFLAPGPGFRAELIDALERAAICSVAAGGETEALAALTAASAERSRTGIVPSPRLKALYGAAGLAASNEQPSAGSFEDALRAAGVALGGMD